MLGNLKSLKLFRQLTFWLCSTWSWLDSSSSSQVHFRVFATPTGPPCLVKCAFLCPGICQPIPDTVTNCTIDPLSSLIYSHAVYWLSHLVRVSGRVLDAVRWMRPVLKFAFIFLVCRSVPQILAQNVALQRIHWILLGDEKSQANSILHGLHRQCLPSYHLYNFARLLR